MGANDKVAATYHPKPAPEPLPFECAECETRHATASDARFCCGWRGYD